MIASCAPRTTKLETDTQAENHAGPNTVKQRGDATISLREENGYLFAPVTINGVYAGWFMVDTGSTLNIVSPGVAGRLRLPKLEGEHNVVGIGGRDTFLFRGVKSVAVADRPLHVEKLAAINMHDFGRSVGLPTSGIVGFGAFDQAPFTLDFVAQTLTVHDPATFKPPANANGPFRWQSNLPLVRAKIGGTRDVMLLLDSGAGQSLVLPTKVAREWPDVLAMENTGGGVTSGVGGAVRATMTWVKSLELLGNRSDLVATSFEPAPPSFANQPVVIGRVGNEVLAKGRFTFDPRSKRVWVKWIEPEQNER